MTNIIGIDIGGANLKYANLDGHAVSHSFPMWKQSPQVAAAIEEHLRRDFSASTIDGLAVTITGELADCFVDRADGIKQLVCHAVEAAGRLKISDVRFYGIDGRFHSAENSIAQPDLIAAANWHALGTYVAREILPDGLLIDIGSTTTDIIPLSGGDVATSATTDHDRLIEGSLVYVGCRRTPVCALVEQMVFRGSDVPIMNELFATIDDACLLWRMTAEDADDDDTADGRPRTRTAAANRIAKMIGLDRREVSVDEAESLAQQVIAAARRRLMRAVEQLDDGGPIVLSGHGDELIELDGRNVISLADRLGTETARCAPAFAVANLLL